MQNDLDIFRGKRRMISIAAMASLFAFGGYAAAQTTTAPSAQPGMQSPVAYTEQQELVNSAETTIGNFMRDPDMDWLQRHIGDAKAVLVAPQIVKAGYIFGGSGGRAVLFVRNASGKWEGPAFYNVGAATVGFQAGISVSETLTLVMTDKGVNSLMAPSIKLGGDASIAAGPVGAGAASDITTDFVAFSRSKGIYGGLNLEGSVIAVNNDWNSAYFGKPVTPTDIVMTGKVRNAEADRIAQELNRVASRVKSSSVK
ncbi:MAG: lipid-binding SYLF domain-containing protein [Betaproteobacteria bacterium]